MSLRVEFCDVGREKFIVKGDTLRERRRMKAKMKQKGMKQGSAVCHFTDGSRCSCITFERWCSENDPQYEEVQAINRLNRRPIVEDIIRELNKELAE